MKEDRSMMLLSFALLAAGIIMSSYNIPILTGMATATGTVNATVDTSVSISLQIVNASFLGLTPGSTNDTTDGQPDPLVIRNDGNTQVNITVATLHNWTFTSEDNDLVANLTRGYLEGKCANNETNCHAESVTTFTPLSTVARKFFALLGYATAGDEARFDINITCPSDETAGSKNNTLTFTSAAGT